MMKTQDLLKKEMFFLESPLKTIKVVSVAPNTWNTFSQPQGNLVEYNDNELKKLVEELTKKHFEIRLPKVNY